MALISASGASTSSTSPMNYHIFMSFRGTDTRKSFTDHLYSALLRKGIVTFRDDEGLERGQFISEKLFKAIKESLFAIIVLSENYTSSPWFLDELQKIVESKKNLGQTVFPVFYNVDPSDIRHQKGNVGTAFEKHKGRFTEDKVRRCSEALTEVAYLSGWDTRDKHESKIVEDIAKSVWNKLCDELPSNFEHLVGIQSKVDKIISLLKVELDDKCFVGIWGMGVVGKTTLARVVYESIRSKFEKSCFLANVTEDSNKVGIVSLQKILLSCFQLQELKINNSYDGGEVIRKFLCRQKVLIVLDDVNHRSQLDNLARNKEWFGAGSKIIVTTRDVQLLTKYEEFELYEVGTLEHDEALKLLCHKAFNKDEPEQGYLDLSDEVVEYACGLPLAIEVLGSFLCKRNRVEWKDMLNKLEQNLHKDIFNSLRLSYDGLEDEECKTIFLDIACFFNREYKDEVKNILKICGLHPIIGFKVLTEKSLLSWSESNSYSRINSEDYLDMHDLLQEMGRKIVVQESPNDAGRRSRLWSLEEIDLVLKGNKGKEKVRSIVLDIQRYFEATWHPDCFSKMRNLILLDLSNVLLTRSLNSLPSALKVLRWDCYALKSLPPIDQLYELEGLQLCNSKIRKLWNGKPSLHKLRIINLSDSKDLTETPDFSGTPNLETIYLDRCKNLVRVHESVGQLKKLVKLSLEACENLVTLPRYLDMTNLEEFVLSGCSKLERLPEFSESMRSLSFFEVRKTCITHIPSSIIHLTSLKYFDLSFCSRLKSISELPPNLIVVADHCPFLEPGLALQHLFASRVSKYPSNPLQSPSHLLYVDLKLPNFFQNLIPTWFEQREYCLSNGASAEFVTITADIPCDVTDYKREWWGIAVCIGLKGNFFGWEDFFMNWKFNDHCHSNQRRGTMTYHAYHISTKLYIGFYPCDKKDSRPHPGGVGSQVDLTISFPRTKDGCTEGFKHYDNNLEIVNCGWRLMCSKDFNAWSASSIDFDAWWRTSSTEYDVWWSTRSAHFDAQAQSQSQSQSPPTKVYPPKKRGVRFSILRRKIC